jgi:hypothetical protein
VGVTNVLDREHMKGLRTALYPTLSAALTALHRHPHDTPECDESLCALMKATASALLRYRRGARDVRDRLVRISFAPQLDDLEFMQRTLRFYLASPPARPVWM